MNDEEEILKQLGNLRGMLKNVEERLERLESQMAATIRMTMIREPAPDPLADIDRRRFAYTSQHDEDGMLYALFGYTGTPNKSFVEIGCGGNGGNSGFFARECGWSGLMVDAEKRAIRKAAQRFDQNRVRFLTATVGSANVVPLLAQHGTPTEPDLVSIDIDSTDYWVVEALTSRYRPRVLVVEYNSVFGPSAAVTIPDAERFVRQPKGELHTYYGASLAALARVARTRGYRLVMTDPTGTNAIFVRNDVGPALQAADVSHAFRYYSSHRSVVNDVGDPVEFFRKNGLSLVEV